MVMDVKQIRILSQDNYHLVKSCPTLAVGRYTEPRQLTNKEPLKRGNCISRGNTYIDSTHIFSGDIRSFSGDFCCKKNGEVSQVTPPLITLKIPPTHRVLG